MRIGPQFFSATRALISVVMSARLMVGVDYGYLMVADAEVESEK